MIKLHEDNIKICEHFRELTPKRYTHRAYYIEKLYNPKKYYYCTQCHMYAEYRSLIIACSTCMNRDTIEKDNTMNLFLKDAMGCAMVADVFVLNDVMGDIHDFVEDGYIEDNDDCEDGSGGCSNEDSDYIDYSCGRTNIPIPCKDEVLKKYNITEEEYKYVAQQICAICSGNCGMCE